MKSDLKSIVNSFVENAVLSSEPIAKLIKNVQIMAGEFSKIMNVLAKINDRLNQHEEAILQIYESQSNKQSLEKSNPSAFDPPRINKTPQKPN